MKNILIKIGCGVLIILKAIAWLFLNTLKITLEMLKIILLLFSFVMRIFLAFLRAGTPWEGGEVICFWDIF